MIRELIRELLAVLPGLMAASAVACVALGLRLRLARATVDARLDTFVAGSLGAPRGQPDGPSFSRRALLPLVAWLARVVNGLLPDRQIERIRADLTMAGLPYSRHLAQFLAAKAALAIGGAVLASLLLAGAPLPRVLVGAGAAGVLGFYLPGLWLRQRIASRRRQVLKALPDALDLLSVSVSAGLGFDGAMLEVVQRWDNPLTEEFAAVLRDMKLGTSRRDALRDFARRTGVEEVRSFVAAVMQADELGASIKDALRIQADQIRLRRRHRAEERARKATIKMLIPMVLFIFPALFIVILGPAVPSIWLLFSQR
jgi:tight adherence protein C